MANTQELVKRIRQVIDTGGFAHSDRLPPEWQPRTREQNQAVLDRLGLSGEFWRLG